MVMQNLTRIASELMREGLSGATPTAVIAAATTPQQRVLVATLETVAASAREAELEPPAIVVIGDIVKARGRLLGEADGSQS
jgi:uroporphyrin-III C-methyltransferase